MRILFLTSRLPFPPNRGDRLRTYHLLRNLGREHEVTLVSFVNSSEEAQMAEELVPYCKEMHLMIRPTARSVITAIGNAWRRQPLQALYYRSRKMQQLVDRVLASEKYEVAYVHLFRMAPYVFDHPELYRIVDLTDVISLEIAASLPYRSWASRVLYRYEQLRIKDYECRVAAWTEEAWLISERDKVKLAEPCPKANLQVVPNGVDLDHYYPAAQMAVGRNLLFVGNLAVFHNIAAIMFLVKQILPIVRQEIPDCMLTIIGAGMSRQIEDLEHYPGVKVLGFVPDLNRALNEAAVFVAPLRFSAGIQNKVLEAMAASVAVVTTSNVNAGLAAIPGQEIVVGDNAHDLAVGVVRLLSDEPYRLRLGQAGRSFVAQRFSWQTAVERMRKIEQEPLWKSDNGIQKAV